MNPTTPNGVGVITKLHFTILRHLRNKWPWISLRGRSRSSIWVQSKARIHIPPSWKCDVISRIRFLQLMRICLCTCEQPTPDFILIRFETNWLFEVFKSFLHTLAPTRIKNKKAVLSQRWPRNAHYTWVPWKFLGLPDYAHGYYSQHFSRAFVRIDPLNVPTKFEVCSFIRSWDNRG